MKRFFMITILLLSAALYAQDEAPTPAKPGDRLHDRPHAVMGEIAWNGLSGGMGIFYSHYFPGTASVGDLAVGVGGTGARFGVRYRYLLVPQKRTSPFLGAGLNYSPGLGDHGVDVEDNNQDTLVVRVKKTANLLLNVGLDLKANNGFVFVPSIGYGFDLMDDDYEVVSGVETPAHRQALKLILKSGFQISFITGWSF